MEKEEPQANLIDHSPWKGNQNQAKFDQQKIIQRKPLSIGSILESDISSYISNQPDFPQWPTDHVQALQIERWIVD